jgi:hypothetical protein
METANKHAKSGVSDSTTQAGVEGKQVTPSATDTTYTASLYLKQNLSDDRRFHSQQFPTMIHCRIEVAFLVRSQLPCASNDKRLDVSHNAD